MNDLDAFESALDGLELGMINDVDAFDALQLVVFNNVKLYRASDMRGRGWNEYGNGPLRVKLIMTSDDHQGWGQMTCHTRTTGAAGLNILIVPNFTMLSSKKEAGRLTFKALSGNFGNNGRVNMYSMKMASSEDATRLRCIVFVLQLAASQAKAGNPIGCPSSASLEAAVSRAFIGSNHEEVDRHLVLSRLGQLAIENGGAFPSNYHQCAEGFIGLPFGQVGRQELRRVEEDAVQEGTLDIAVATQVTNDEGDELDEKDAKVGSDASSLGSYSDFPESQDWYAAFMPDETK